MALQEQIGKIRELGPRTVTFGQEVWAELKKVHWPARKETYTATVVVLIIVAVVGVFLGIVDASLSQVIQVVLR